MVKCSRCGENIIAKTDFTPGYGRIGKAHKIICYGCCADLDKKHMKKEGRIALYLTKDKHGRWTLSNWPGTLVFRATGEYLTDHYIPNAGWVKKHHVWFTDESGNHWYGYQIGSMTEICHCRRLKH